MHLITHQKEFSIDLKKLVIVIVNLRIITMAKNTKVQKICIEYFTKR